MNDEIRRRSFFSALAFSPLALLGLGKKPDNSDVPMKRMYETKEFYRTSADHWRDRALEAEKKLQALRKGSES